MTLPTDTLSLSPAQLPHAIKTARAANRPLLIHGEPGIGKTDIPKQVAATLGIGFELFRPAAHEATDLLATMYADPATGQARFRPLPFFTATQPTMLLVDEVNRAHKMMFNAFLGLFGPDRTAGGNTLPPHVYPLATANYGHSQGTQEMGDALNWRFIHVDLLPAFNDWEVWATVNQLDAGLVAFLQSIGRPLFCPANPNTSDRSTPNPRSWHAVSDLLKADPSPSHVSHPTTRALIQGTVGQHAAHTCLAYLHLYRAMQGASIPAILASPVTADVPADLNARYAIAAALSHAVTPSNIAAAATYLERLPAEYSTYAIRQAVKRDARNADTLTYTQFCLAHPE